MRRFMILVSLLWLSATAQARLTIELTHGVNRAIPIAVVPFANESAQEDRVSAIVHSDLALTGRFRLLPQEHCRKGPLLLQKIEATKWRDQGCGQRCRGSCSASGQGRYQISFFSRRCCFWGSYRAVAVERGTERRRSCRDASSSPSYQR